MKEKYVAYLLYKETKQLPAQTWKMFSFIKVVDWIYTVKTSILDPMKELREWAILYSGQGLHTRLSKGPFQDQKICAKPLIYSVFTNEWCTFKS